MPDTFIRLDSVGLEYPIYSVRAQSLRYAAVNMAVGGRLFKGQSDRVVVRALDGINLSLSSGDRLALVGPNGAGKSSLLKVLAGVYQPTRGKVDVGGRVASMLDIGHGLDMEASGIQNIRLLSCMRGYSPWRLKDKVDEIVEFSGLGAFINMPVRTYSAGMLARLLFSVATAFDYDVLLLEEWLSAGDASFVRKATQRMADFISQSRVIVTATHSIDLVKTLCNKVLRLEHGSPTFFGTVEEYLIAFPPQ